MNRLLVLIKLVKPLGNNAANIVILNLLLKPLKYFEISTMLHHDENHKIINSEICNWPVAITWDGCQVTTPAGDDLATNIWMISPNMRCGCLDADGSLKIMANSKTMNVGAVTEFLPFFQKIM